MVRIFITLLAVCTLFACKKEEEPTFPPTVEEPSVTCGDPSTQKFGPVEEIAVPISDPDRDLVADSIVITVNGVLLEEIGDDDADDVYTWNPPTSWDPKMVCSGSFTIIVEARDAEGQSVKQTFKIDDPA